MRKTIAIVLLSIGLAACGVVSSLVDGIKYANAVADDLEQLTGLKPAVGFNSNNGRLTSVTVSYPSLYDGKPLRELAEATRAAVIKEFKETPENIVLAFSLGQGAPDAATPAGRTPH
jgi:hypothetical protein